MIMPTKSAKHTGSLWTKHIFYNFTYFCFKMTHCAKAVQVQTVISTINVKKRISAIKH